MNITTKTIITDTNIISDLNNANVLKKFIEQDNVFIIDLIKYDEINSDTGNTTIISKCKIIDATANQLTEIRSIRLEKPKLSTYDALNYIVARDNNYILATGDNELRKYCENHGVNIIRTLKIIELMNQNNIISTQKAIKACILLKEHPTTRIPKDAINQLINKLEKDFITT